jgi:hypothetical protein
MSYVEDVAHQISAKLAARLGVPEPPNAWRAFAAQVANETGSGDPSTRGVRNNNPLNLTDAGGSIEWPGQVGRDDVFAIFSSTDAGISASVQNLLAPSYEGVRNAFIFGDPIALTHAIERSPWDAGHYSDRLVSLVPGINQDGTAIGPVGPTGPNDQPPAPGVAESRDCPPGKIWSEQLQMCVTNQIGSIGGWIPPFVPGPGARPGLPTIGGTPGQIASEVGTAVKAATDGIGKSIDDFKNTIGTGARNIAIAGVVIGAIVVLGYGGLKRALD